MWQLQGVRLIGAAQQMSNGLNHVLDRMRIGFTVVTRVSVACGAVVPSATHLRAHLSHVPSDWCICACGSLWLCAGAMNVYTEVPDQANTLLMMMYEL